MRVLIRDNDSGYYFAANNRWVADSTVARDFKEPLGAIQFASEHGLPCADVVCEFGPDRERIVMPIPLGFPPRKQMARAGGTEFR
jgi:hypothetical protein